ncbi:transporter [Rhodovulum sp. 12E13]|uniref:transporter n=1 Tax=Rhodovulum sp. 12E13 TaxID=2203891 RepID=UPI000E153EE6|nr:transporter [Rhodovulum sp. 12E13]RDC68985.1 transporter [Rhodovulum sp. 12E13]
MPAPHPARALAAVALAAILPAAAAAQDADLAQTLTNPVADLVSLPVQLNFDEGLGADDKGRRTTLNIQPVYPVRLSDDWNLISRTIIPVIWQEDVLPDSEQSGMGDILQSVFLSPASAGAGGGLIWGAGLAFGLPTATDDALGTGKWTAGPTAAALRMDGPFTYGALFNHLWSVGGDEDRADVNQSFVQPFFSYVSPAAVTFTASAEAAYDWEREVWSVPVNFTVARLVDIGGQKVSLQGGVRYWADSPDGGPEGVGFRIGTTFLFPR